MKGAVLFICLLSMFLGSAQEECALGVGGMDDETIAEVFQLNEEQKESLKNWSAELKIRNEILRNRAEFLLKQHEESPPEVLMTVSREYKTIMDSMKLNIRMMDKRLLSIFNPKQYGFYVKLCDQLTLRPIHVNKSVDEK